VRAAVSAGTGSGCAPGQWFGRAALWEWFGRAALWEWLGRAALGEWLGRAALWEWFGCATLRQCSVAIGIKLVSCPPPGQFPATWWQRGAALREFTAALGRRFAWLRPWWLALVRHAVVS
jgi:hypothetical protein